MSDEIKDPTGFCRVLVHCYPKCLFTSYREPASSAFRSINMSYHVRLRETSCIICRQSTEPCGYRDSIQEYQRVAAVIGDASSKPPIVTLPFEYPAHGYEFANAVVYINGREERWRLCRRLGCPTCLASPEAFVFHMECFRLIRRMAIEQTNNQGPQDEHGTLLYDALWRIWLAGHWSRPWTKLFYEVRPPLCASPAPLAKIEILDKEYAMLLGKIILLPPELIRMIVDHSLDSLLWRYALALAWPSGVFGNLTNGKTITLSPNNLCRWHRDGGLQTCVHQHKYVRFTLDGDGIKVVEFLDRRTVVPQSGCEDRDTWYIFEDFARLKDFRLQSNGGFLRIQPRKPQDACTLWDTPSPPTWSSCNFFGSDSKIPQRVRTIPLDTHITGITVFCSGGRTYSIHAHRDRSSAIDTYLRLPKRRQQDIIWIYFPFGDGEDIKDIWIRYRKGPTRSTPTLVIYTSYDRLYTFGQHIEWDNSRYEHHYLCSGPRNCLLYHDPDPGEPISCFGASSRTARADHSLKTLGKVVSRPADIPIDRDSIYCSYASLEDVDNVRCFYESCTDEQPTQVCIGILLEYSDKRRAALGQCRIGASHDTLVTAPTAMYVNRIRYGNNHAGVLVQFTSVQSKEFDKSDWERKEMVGEILWWFEHGIVEIIHSQESI